MNNSREASTAQRAADKQKGTDLAQSGKSFTLKPGTDGKGIFILAKQSTLETYTDFSSFVEALKTKLSGSSLVKRVVVQGSFNASDNSMTVKKLTLTYR